MAFKTTCDGCGTKVFGVFSSLRKVGDRYLCATCATNPTNKPKYYCNSCHNHTPTALMKGNGWVEFVLYLFYIVPGIIYSVWRRSAPPNVCPLCQSPGLVHAAAAKPAVEPEQIALRDEIDCPHCAERILAKANTCKHCGKQVRVVA